MTTYESHPKRRLTAALLILTAALGALCIHTARAESAEEFRARSLEERRLDALLRIERHLDKLASAQLDRHLDDTTQQLQECTRALRDNTRALERRQ